MKVVVVLVSIVLFLVCLITGVYLGQIGTPSGGSEVSHSGPTSDSSQTAAGDPQRTVLFLYVDQFSSADPQLQAVWLAIYRSSVPRITLLPLYPAGPVLSPEGSALLATQFSLDSDGRPGQAFLEVLAQNQVRWDGYTIVDQPGATAWIDGLGGLDHPSGHLDGSTVVQMLSAAQADPNTALQHQQSLAISMCARLNQMPAGGADPDLAATLIPPSARSSLDPAALVQDWLTMFGKGGGVTCEIPSS